MVKTCQPLSKNITSITNRIFLLQKHEPLQDEKRRLEESKKKAEEPRCEMGVGFWFLVLAEVTCERQCPEE